MAHARAQQLLREGIALARNVEGRDKGRQRLREAVELDASCETAWLWLAGLAPSPEEALQALERVLSLNPGNEKARAATRAARLQAGINAARAQDKPRARILLRQAAADDPQDEQAWLWLASVAESSREGVACLERVLQLNPANERARSSLERHRAREATRSLRSAPALATVPLDEITDEESCGEALGPACACPFCEREVEQGTEKCPRCGSLLVLTPVSLYANWKAPEQGRLLAFVAANDGRKGEAEAPDPREEFGARYRLGLAHLNLRRFDAARAVLEQALLVEPDNGEVRAAVAELARVCEDKAREAASNPRGTILVVDDDAAVCKLVALTLEAEGFQVRSASNGEEAIDDLREHGLPDLVLLDIVLPGMNGYQLCKLLRQNPDTSHLPVIMLSGSDGFLGKVRSAMAGFTETLFKPFEARSLVRVTERFCPPSLAMTR